MDVSGNVVVLNPGSATLKWVRFHGADPVERGKSDIVELESVLESEIQVSSARRFIVRFVHGGSRFIEPAILSATMLPELERVSELAPLHNRNSLLCARQLLERRPGAQVIAVFDTQFFHSLPPVAQLYGLPDALTEKYQLRRYGFHGFAHQSMLRAWQAQHGERRPARLITMQLGSGCSMAAIRDGQPMDTTMGFTPNEGLLMSTRSGDLDPGLLTWLQRQEGWTPEETERILNEEAGWCGMSNESANMADLLASPTEKSRLAVDLFCHRVRKTLGGYYALLGGLDGVLMSGGVAERAPVLRQRLLQYLEHLGIGLDERANGSPGDDGVISARDSPVQCRVVAADEATAMLHEVHRAQELTHV